MVVLLDLGGESGDPAEPFEAVKTAAVNGCEVLAEVTEQELDAAGAIGLEDESSVDSDGHDPNVNSFSNCLGCYPIVSQLARHLDLNSIHDLALTCQQFRHNLLQYRSQLMKHALRCVNEHQHTAHKLGNRLRESHQAWLDGVRSGAGERITSGRVGSCARDMVGECRRCSMVVCRNCTIKTPASNALAGRHRRLCRTCIKVPLHYLTTTIPDVPATPTTPDLTERLQLLSSTKPDCEGSFTAEAFARSPCTCQEMVWLCHTCGTQMRSSDTTYMRGWTWRTRYSTYLGGLGTGIGEGNEGVECGLGARCLAAKEVEKEIDCAGEELAELTREIEIAGKDGRQWGGTSYFTQEMEGIGGVVKKKVKKRVRIGAVVKEYEDERDTGEYLGRERSGQSRSWCRWCARVIPGIKDQEQWPWNGAELESTSSAASSVKSQ